MWVKCNNLSVRRSALSLRALPAAAVPLVLTAALLVAGFGELSAHGGYPLRLGVRNDPALVPLSRVVLLYLDEGQGMNVSPTYFPVDADLTAEYDKGRIDLFLEVPAAGWLIEHCPPDTVADEGAKMAEHYFSGSFPNAWAGLFTFPLSGSTCARPAIIAHAKVVRELRFGLLRSTLQKVVDAVGAVDYATLTAEGGGGRKEANAAARALLKRKGLI